MKQNIIELYEDMIEELITQEGYSIIWPAAPAA
jgi:hypothetical protein